MHFPQEKPRRFLVFKATEDSPSSAGNSPYLRNHMNGFLLLRFKLVRGGLWSVFPCLFAALAAAGEVDRIGEGRTLRVDDSHADFADGRLSASGRNLYITQAGSIKQVFSYDLNQDGWADLLFNSAHDFILAPPVTLVDLSKSGPGSVRDLTGIGARTLKSGDFDADGRTDLLTIPESQWVSTRGYLHVYWGTKLGQWSQASCTDLLANDPIDAEVMDGDRDGFPDVMVLMNGGDQPGAGRRILRVYWGGAGGFFQASHTDFDAVGIGEIEADTSANGLLALVADGTALELLNLSGRKLVRTKQSLPGAKLGNLRTWSGGGATVVLASSDLVERQRIDPTTAKEVGRWSRLARITLDLAGTATIVHSPPLSHTSFAWSERFPDILLITDVNKPTESVRVVTTFDPATMGFGSSIPLAEPGHVSGAALVESHQGTLVALATERNAESYDVASRLRALSDVLHGRGTTDAVKLIPTRGASGVVSIAPGAQDTWQGERVAFLNRIGGSYLEHVPTMIYWGDPRGFSAARRLDLPFYSGIQGAVADVNDDAHADLILVSQVHHIHTPKPYMGMHLFKGTSQAEFSDATILQEYGVRGLAIADLDRDGWLDLIGSILNGPTASRGWVLWRGGPAGFAQENRLFFPFPLAHGLPAIGDVDRDGWLEVAVPSMRGNEIRLYRNDHGRFDPAGFDSLPAWQANQLDFADMNADGYLDLVSASGLGPGTFFRDYGIQIFFGGADGYDPKYAQRLPAHGAVGFLIQDWDQDGHLDIFAPNYHSGIMREGTSAKIYWGGATGLDSNRHTYLPVDGAAGAFAMDFDANGTLDIAISSHTTDGSHHTQSPVYYNRDGRFGEPQEKVLLPTIGPQQMYSSGAGDQYGRKLQEWYESAFIPLEGCQQIRISATGRVRTGTALRLSYRTAAAESELADAVWQEATSGEWRTIPTGSQVLQYRVSFHAIWRSGQYPELDRVEIKGR